MTRKQLLNALLEFKMPLNSLLAKLAAFGWDCEDELIRLNRSHVIRILNRFQTGQLSAGDVEDWANAVEGRDDIGFENGYEDMLSDMIYELANPDLTQPLSPGMADARLIYESDEKAMAVGM